MEAIKIAKDNIVEGHRFFEKYVATFLDTQDKQVIDALQLKKEHSKRVAKISRVIAEKILLDEEEQELAELIGLWHDLGRFPQFETYKTFNDIESDNHADIGVSLLREQAFFQSLPELSQRVIIGAIGYHNQLAIPAKEDKQIILYSQILRDADKLDIWDTCVTNLQRDGSFRIPSISYNLPLKGTINPAVFRSIENQKTVIKKELQSVDDFKLFLISMVFDLNFKVSFQMLNESQMVKKIYDSLPKKDEVFDAYREIRLYVENKFVI